MQKRNFFNRIFNHSSNHQEQIDYLINDWTTPSLIKTIDPPKNNTNLKFTVNNYSGGSKDRNNVAFQAANSFVTVTNFLNFHGHFTDNPLAKWAGTSNLVIVPRRGADLNAYYDRRTLSFFCANIPDIGWVHTADSSDIVAHELGHAILDSYRPTSWNVASLEIWSFHEAFADLSSIINLLSHREIIEHVLIETGGNLRENNVVSSIAEHVGSAIHKVTGGSSGHQFCLRNANNNFKYINPRFLPSEATDGELAAECHSFGRIYLGAFYDILEMMYQSEVNSGLSRFDALVSARDTLFRYVLLAIQNAPLNSNFYESISKTLLWTDVKLNNWKYHSRMLDIFHSRRLMKPQVKLLSAPSCDNQLGIMSYGTNQVMKLRDHVIRAQSTNELYDVEVEVPNEKVFLYDNDGNVFDSIETSEPEAIAGAAGMIDFLYETKQYGVSENDLFVIVDNKLQRNLIQ